MQEKNNTLEFDTFDEFSQYVKEPSNETVEKPKVEVKWENYTKRNCKFCFGKGFQKWFNAKDKTSSLVPCKCAVRNYIKEMRKSGQILFQKPS